MVKLIASCICTKDNYLMVQSMDQFTTLPSTVVDDNISVEMALNDFFLNNGWHVAIANLRYILEKFENEGKKLYLVYTGRILKEGMTNNLQFMNIEELDLNYLYPKMLFAKMLADKGKWDSPLCTTLVSW